MLCIQMPPLYIIERNPSDSTSAGVGFLNRDFIRLVVAVDILVGSLLSSSSVMQAVNTHSEMVLDF